jgi:hypothetical protein
VGERERGWKNAREGEGKRGRRGREEDVGERKTWKTGEN